MAFFIFLLSYAATSQPPKKCVARFSIPKTWSNPRQRRAYHVWLFVEWNAINTCLPRALSKNLTLPHVAWHFLTRDCVFFACFLSKALDKTACLCYDISCKWQVFICSDQIFRGIAQLVEQRSPNVNTVINFPINTELSRLGTSVSSLFSCFRFCKVLKWIMQNRGRNLQKIS